MNLESRPLCGARRSIAEITYQSVNYDYSDSTRLKQIALKCSFHISSFVCFS